MMGGIELDVDGFATGLLDGLYGFSSRLTEEEMQASYEEYQNYWTGRLPLMAPGGVEVFVDSGYDVLRGEGPQWVPDHNEQFFPSDYDTLPIPVPCQVRVWLEDYTVQAEGNPWEMDNASAAWQITSLKADDQVYPGQSDTEQAYTLEAQAENGSGETLTAILLFDQEEGKVTRDVEVIWGSDNTQEAAPLTLDDAFAPHAPLTHQEAPAMLENLTLEDFPTQPIDLLDWANWEGWENLVYLLRRYAGSVERFFDYDRSQVCCRYCAQFAAHRSDRGTAGACQYNFLCHMIFLLMMRLPKGPLSPAPGILM